MATRVAVDADVDHSTANRIITRFLDQVTAAVARGERVNLRGFGVFEPRARRAVTRHGAVEVDVPARTAIAFRPADRLKALINKEKP